MELAQYIGRKWAAFTQNTNGNFLRYKDGNMDNNSPENIEEVTAIEAMNHVGEWTVDWTLPLNDREVAFVKSNSQNFAALLRE